MRHWPLFFWSLPDELVQARLDGLEAERRVVAMQENVVAMKGQVVAMERSRDLWVWTVRDLQRAADTREKEMRTLRATYDELLAGAVDLRGQRDFLEKELADTQRAYREIVDRLAQVARKESER